MGKIPAGIEVLYKEEWGGGSGVFTSIMLVVFKKRSSCEFDDVTGSIKRRNQSIIEKICAVPLGDRWDGRPTLQGNELTIEKFTYIAVNGERKKGSSVRSVLKIDDRLLN